MTTEVDLGLTKVSRRVVMEKTHGKFECAVRRDLTSPAAEALDQLQKGEWPDPDCCDLPDSRQSNDLARLIAAIEDVADGYNPPYGATNYLNDGIWEFKIGTIRMTFYDTDGYGSPVTKSCVVDYGIGGKVKYLPEDFGYLIRLGHTFGKSTKTRKTPLEDQQCAYEVRKEDLEHDH